MVFIPVWGTSDASLEPLIIVRYGSLWTLASTGRRVLGQIERKRKDWLVNRVCKPFVKRREISIRHEMMLSEPILPRPFLIHNRSIQTTEPFYGMCIVWINGITNHLWKVIQSRQSSYYCSCIFCSHLPYGTVVCRCNGEELKKMLGVGWFVASDGQTLEIVCHRRGEWNSLRANNAHGAAKSNGSFCECVSDNLETSLFFQSLKSKRIQNFCTTASTTMMKLSGK
jgi:hypothetical protein